jgi:hypothetical protein
VDLRYERQIIVNPDLRGTARQPELSAATAKAAILAGVKPAALVMREPSKSAAQRPVPVNAAASRYLQKPRKDPQPHKVAGKTRWHKRWIPAKHAGTKPVGTKPGATRLTGQIVSASQSAPLAIKKPSPAITKGAANR